MQANIAALLDHSEAMMRSELASLPEGVFEAEDFLDDDGIVDRPVRIAVRVQTEPRESAIEIDFSDSDDQVSGSLNAVQAVTYSAVFYVFRCLLPDEAVATAGLMRPVRLITRPGSVVHAVSPAAVAGGNVETSQRIVDVLMKAFSRILPERMPAASSGSMSNVTIGGVDVRNGGRPFAYYETIAGGTGARPNADGIPGSHTHMTNSLNTPVEALEYAYPFRVRRYGYRTDSGGAGRYRGGDGLIRELELLTEAQITLLTDRRKIAPYGLYGGEDGQPGLNLLNGMALPAKCNVRAKPGDVLRIETPGGGGWGSKP